MVKQVTISQAARRYAQAAFEMARDAGQLETLEKDMTRLSAALAESADLRAVAASPVIDVAVKTRAVLTVADKLGLSPLGRNLTGVALRNGRGADLAGIAAGVREALLRHHGMVEVEVVSAHALTPDQRDQIVAGVAKSLGAKVDAKMRVDESLLGGFLVRAGSRQFDASVKSKLQSLKLALTSA